MLKLLSALGTFHLRSAKEEALQEVDGESVRVVEEILLLEKGAVGMRPPAVVVDAALAMTGKPHLHRAVHTRPLVAAHKRMVARLVMVKHHHQLQVQVMGSTGQEHSDEISKDMKRNIVGSFGLAGQVLFTYLH